MDYDAYHLRLIGDRIGYEFPQGSVHEHMAKFYGCDYEESKQKSFQYLYGFIPYEVSQINPFFCRVDDYIKELWNSYKSKDFILSFIIRIHRIHFVWMGHTPCPNVCNLKKAPGG